MGADSWFEGQYKDFDRGPKGPENCNDDDQVPRRYDMRLGGPIKYNGMQFRAANTRKINPGWCPRCTPFLSVISAYISLHIDGHYYFWCGLC